MARIQDTIIEGERTLGREALSTLEAAGLSRQEISVETGLSRQTLSWFASTSTPMRNTRRSSLNSLLYAVEKRRRQTAERERDRAQVSARQRLDEIANIAINHGPAMFRYLSDQTIDDLAGIIHQETWNLIQNQPAAQEPAGDLDGIAVALDPQAPDRGDPDAEDRAVQMILEANFDELTPDQRIQLISVLAPFEDDPAVRLFVREVLARWMRA